MCTSYTAKPPQTARSTAGVSSCLQFKYDYCNHSSIREINFLIKEALIQSLSDFAISIMMQGKEKDDANS